MSKVSNPKKYEILQIWHDLNKISKALLNHKQNTNDFILALSPAHHTASPLCINRIMVPKMKFFSGGSELNS